MSTYNVGIKLVPTKVVVGTSSTYTVPANHVFVGSGRVSYAASATGAISVDGVPIAWSGPSGSVPNTTTIFAGAGAVITTTAGGSFSGFLLTNTV